MKGLSLKPRLDLGVSGEVGSIHKSFWGKKAKEGEEGRGREREERHQLSYLL